MRRLLPFLIAAPLALGACGSTTTRIVTVAHPPNLGPPGPDAKDTGGDLAPLQQNGNVTLRSYRPKHGNPEMARFYNASGCGVERWAVKTLTDPAANQVNLTPQDSSIADLVTIAPPVSPTDRVGPTETSTFRISGTVIFAKAEADGDYHLGLADAQGNTMIAESSDPKCAAGSLVLKQMEEVRASLDAKFPGLAQGQVLKPGVQVTVTGVGFFDRRHGQTAVAPNAIEIHPITAMSYTSGASAHARVPSIHLKEVPGTD
jgi:hypothetical protein